MLPVLKRFIFPKSSAQPREVPLSKGERQLANDPHELRDGYDTVVIGSGYGGAFPALYASAAGKSVAVLERGLEWKPTMFPETLPQVGNALQSPWNRLGLLHLDGFGLGNDFVRLSASATGGTSTINGGVFGMAPRESYSPANGWPAEMVAPLFEKFETAKRIVDPQPFPVRGRGPVPLKLTALRDTAKLQAEEHPGHEAAQFRVEPHLVRNREGPNAAGVEQHACTKCGNCLPGCNVGAKGSLDRNVLQIAKRQGAEFYVGAEATRLQRNEDGTLTVSFVRRHGFHGWRKEKREIRAKSVVVAGGVQGTQKLLQATAADPRSGLSFSPFLGQDISNDADTFAFAVNGEIRNAPFGTRHPKPGEQDSAGPLVSVSAYRRGWDASRKENIQDASVPGAFVRPYKLGVLAFSLWSAVRSRSVSRMAQALHAPWNRSQILLGVGAEQGSGRMERSRFGRLRMKWNGTPYDQDQGVASLHGFAREMASAAGADYVPVKLLGRTLSTHPLGGVPLGKAVSTRGELLDREGEAIPGLYVTDGSVLPAAVGFNPSATISAFSSLASDSVLDYLHGLEVPKESHES